MMALNGVLPRSRTSPIDEGEVGDPDRPRIVVRGLSKFFKSGRDPEGVPAVDDVSLEVGAGEIVALLGPSGSGKTTLLRCIAGLERADRGEIEIEGATVYSSSKRILVSPERRGIGMVFQSYALWPHMTTFSNVAYPLRRQGVAKRIVVERVQRALELVDCGGLGKRYPSELSGGQQQRVAVARAIVGGNKVILFDEPLSSVDALVREELRRELSALQRELGFSALYITHDQVEAMAIGHRVAVLASGRIAQIGDPRELYVRPSTGYVARFLGASNRFDAELLGLPDSTVAVQTPIGILPVAEVPDNCRESAVSVVFRPEQVRLTDCGHSLHEPLCGTIQQSLFLGSTTEYVIEVGEARVSARSDRILSVGDHVRIQISPEDLHVVRRS